MDIRKGLFVMSILVTSTVLAQSDTVRHFINRMESSPDHASDIRYIQQWLGNKNLTDEDQIALQSALVKEYYELNQWDTCLSFCQQRVADARRAGNTLAEATFLKLIGNTYYHIPDKEKAIPYWEKCRDISAGHGYYILWQQSLNNLAGYYIDLNINLEKAEAYLLRAIEVGKKNPLPDNHQLNQNYRLLATLYDRMNQPAKSAAIFEEVIRRSREQGDSVQLAEALMFYSRALSRIKNFSKAIQTGAMAVAMTEKSNRLDLLSTALTLQAENLALAGAYKDAYEIKLRLDVLNSQRFTIDLNEKISAADARLKTAETEHEKQLALLKAKKEKQLLVYGLIGVFIIMVLVLYNYYQRRHNRQRLLLQAQVQEEKTRLSRDLHDNLGSQLTLLSNNIEQLDILYRKEQELGGSLENVKNSSRQLLQTLRETIWILNREQVTAADFFDKLVDYTHRFLQQANGMQLRVEENFAASRELHSNEALQLFRISQEAINNATKYSGAAELLLSGRVSDGRFKLQIADKGRGFNSAEQEDDGHYGLKNMRERADSIHAELKLDTGPGEGTTITIIV